MSMQLFQNLTYRSHARSTLALLIPVIYACFISLATAQPEVVLSPQHIEQRLKALKAGGVAEDNEIVTTYQQAASFLNAADSFNRDAANYADAMTSEPLREAKIQARMDAFEDQVEPVEGISELPTTELEAQLVATRAELNETTDDINTLNRRLAAREANVETIRTRLGEIDSKVDSLPDERVLLDLTAQPSLTEAGQWRNASEALALAAERRTLNARLTSQPVRYSAMATARAEATLVVERLSLKIRALEKQLGEQVLAMAEPDALAIAANAPSYTVASGLLEMDSTLRKEHLAVNDKLTTARNYGDQVERKSEELSDRFATARRMVDFGGDSEVLGSVLQVYWNEIENFQIPYSTRNLSSETGGTVIARIKHEEELKELVSASAYINRQLTNAGIGTDIVSAANREILVALARAYRNRLRDTIDTQSAYLEVLRELGDGYVELSRRSNEYKKYLQSLILWLPVRPPLWNSSKDSVPMELAALVDAVRNTTLSVQPDLIFGLAAFALLLSLGARLNAAQVKLNKLISRPRHDAIRYTVFSLICTAFRALPAPLLVMGIATLFSNETATTVLTSAGVALFVFSSVRLVCEPTGVGPIHFDWPETIVARIHKESGWLIRIGVPLATAAFWIMGETTAIGDAVLGRIAIITVMALPLIYTVSSIASYVNESHVPWFKTLPNQMRMLLVVVLGFLIAGVVLGYSYSVTVIFASLVDSIMVGFFLLLVHGVLSRWVVVTRRGLRLLELMSAITDQSPADDAAFEDPEADLGEVSAESKELINMGTFVTGFIALIYIWAPLLPAFEALTQVTLWTSSSTVDGQTIENDFTLAALLTVVALIVVTIYAARKLPALIELILRSRTDVSPSSRYTAIALLNYVIVGGGITAALSALGLQWSELQWLVAALGVGIGFGLQEIIANFISGLIILFERPIRVGDVISTGGNDGTVTRIRIRATSIRDWDGKELLVPNKEFITGRLLNWTLSDAKVRTVIPVGIAYGSDVELAIKTLHSAVNSHRRVIDDPPLQIIFEGFGDDALLLSARFYLDSLEDRLLAVTEINREIYRTLNDAGIVIAFPQRDVHFDSDKPIKIAFDKSEDGPLPDA